MRQTLLIVIALAGCSTSKDFEPATGGNPEAGKTAIQTYGCAACHDIPGVNAPGGRVGPPLHGFSRRAFIGGELPNTPDNLQRWVRDPHAIEKHTAMPSLGLSAKEARDVAAYLYTLD